MHSSFLEARGIRKHFPGVQALDDVSLGVQPGEVLAVVGENGAGKSTLMKILGGIYQSDAGTIHVQGQAVTIGAVKDAERLGIVLILDEPTSSLTERETARLFDVIRDLKSDGISVVYISHRLKEIEAIADRVTVLRDGRNAGELDKAHIRHDAIVRLMVGRELK